MQGDDKTCAGDEIEQSPPLPNSQVTDAPACTEKHKKAPSPSAGRAQKLDPDLQRLAELWPSLPEEIQASIFTIAEITKKERS